MCLKLNNPTCVPIQPDLNKANDDDKHLWTNCYEPEPRGLVLVCLSRREPGTGDGLTGLATFLCQS